MVPSCRYEALHGSAHICHAHATKEFFMLASQETQLMLRKDHARELTLIGRGFWMLLECGGGAEPARNF